MTREEKLQKAHQMFDNRNLLTELKWQRNYFNRGYVSKQEELFNLWIFDECIKALEQEPRKGHWIKTPKAVMGEGYMWYCDKCRHQVYQDSSRDYPSEKFCPNCGSDNREVEE